MAQIDRLESAEKIVQCCQDGVIGLEKLGEMADEHFKLYRCRHTWSAWEPVSWCEEQRECRCGAKQRRVGVDRVNGVLIVSLGE